MGKKTRDHSKLGLSEIDKIYLSIPHSFDQVFLCNTVYVYIRLLLLLYSPEC